jgi:hypothetical protein
LRLAPGKRLARPHFNKKLGLLAHACHPSYLEGTYVLRPRVGLDQAKNMRPYLKTKAKWTGGMVKVVVCLPSKHKGPEFKL